MKQFMQASVGLLCFIGAVFLASRLGDTNVERASKALQGIAAVIVACTALLGLEAWKKKTRYGRHVDAAAEVMYHLFEFEARFHEARSMFGGVVDLRLDGAERVQRQQEVKFERLKAMKEEFNALVRAIAKVDLWKADFCKSELQALRVAAIDLGIANQAHFAAELDPDQTSNADWAAQRREWSGRVYGVRDDAFGSIVDDNAARIRRACRDLIR